MEIFWKTIGLYNTATWEWQLGIILIGIILTVLLTRNPQPWVKNGMKIYLIAVYLWISVIYYYIYCAERSYNEVMALFWAIMAILWGWDALSGYTTFERTRKLPVCHAVYLSADIDGTGTDFPGNDFAGHALFGRCFHHRAPVVLL